MCVYTLKSDLIWILTVPFQSCHLRAKRYNRTGVIGCTFGIFSDLRENRINYLLDSVVQKKWIKSIILIRILKSWIESGDLEMKHPYYFTKSPKNVPLPGWHLGGMLLFESLIKKLDLNFF